MPSAFGSRTTHRLISIRGWDSLPKVSDREKTLAMIRALYANYRLPEWKAG